MELFKLVGSILVDNSKANESISKTSEKTDSFANKLTSGVKTAGKWALGVGAAATAVGGAMFAMADSAANSMDKIAKDSQKIGITTDAYQELDFVLQHNGTSLDACSKSFKTFGDKLDVVMLKGNASESAFGKLGIALKDSEGKARSHTDVMYDSIKALADMEDTTKRNGLAQEMFGSKYTEMIPLLNSGSASFDELTGKAHELGLVMGEESIKQGEAFNDNMQDVKQSLGALKDRLGAELLPLINQVLQWVMAHMPEIQAFITKAFNVISTVISALMPIVQKVFSYIGIAMNEFVIPAINKGIEIFNKIMNKAGDMKKKFDDVVSGIKKLFSGFTLKMPEIKTPHFSITPEGWHVSDLLKGKIPKLGIKWYKEAMDEPMALNGATIFGAANGRLLGGGETGKEYISGKEGIKKALVEALEDFGMGIYLDGKYLVGYVNKGLAKNAKMELRGIKA